MTVVDGYSILAGTANSALASAIAERLGSPLTPCRIDRFPDGEIAVQLLAPVRRKEVFLVQPTSPPVNDHLIELLAVADACRRASAAHITAVVPYYGYGRADKRHGRRESARQTTVTHVVGDVGDRACLIIDDMIATGGTIAETARVLYQSGAAPEVTVAATHGLFLEGALEKLMNAGVRTIFTTDTIPQTTVNRLRVQVVSVASVIATALQRFMADG